MPDPTPLRAWLVAAMAEVRTPRTGSVSWAHEMELSDRQFTALLHALAAAGCKIVPVEATEAMVSVGVGEMAALGMRILLSDRTITTVSRCVIDAVLKAAASALDGESGDGS